MRRSEREGGEGGREGQKTELQLHLTDGIGRRDRGDAQRVSIELVAEKVECELRADEPPFHLNVSFPQHARYLGSGGKEGQRVSGVRW